MNPTHVGKIGTYSGKFHCSQVLACFMLKQLPEYKNATIVRTRDDEVLNDCDVVVGVGHVYDAAKKRFDHRQRMFDETMNSLNSVYKWKTKLSSAGLIYFHYGCRFISEILKVPADSNVVSKIYAKMYESFIEEVDAKTNGVDHCSGEPYYHITTNLNARIFRINLPWNIGENEDDSALFRKAMEVAGNEMIDRVRWYADSWIPAYSTVLDSVRKRDKQIDPSLEIIIMEQWCPWKDHLHEIEDELKLQKSIKFVLYPAQDCSWRVQCVPVKPESYHTRLSLPEPWRGLKDQALASLSKLEDAMFVHASGFIGGCRTQKSALAMATKTLERAEKQALLQNIPALVAVPDERNIIWIDMEMTGLDLNKDRIIEVACIVTGPSLTEVAEGPNVVLQCDDNILQSMDEWCQSTHQRSGLIEEVKCSLYSVEQVEQMLLDFVSKYTPPGKCPLAGSSVQYDRAFLAAHMPRFIKHLHYRIVDVSSIKELTKRWYPGAEPPPKQEIHRALPDIRESIAELRWYRENVFVASV